MTPHWHLTPALIPGPPCVNIIADNDSTVDGNMFCFGAFADKRTGTLYNNLTNSFPLISLDRNMCYLIVKTNAILALPIANLEDTTIFDGYKITLSFWQAKVTRSN